jgi:hypothetical protein
MKQTLGQPLVVILALAGALINLILFMMSIINGFLLLGIIKGLIIFIVPAVITLILLKQKKFILLNIPFAFAIISTFLYQKEFQEITFFLLSVAALSSFFISSLLANFLKNNKK